MTVTARGAVLLRTAWTRHAARRYLASNSRRNWRSLNAPALAARHRLRPRRAARLRAMRRHLARLYEAAPSSPEIAHALLAVQHLLRPAESLMEIHAI